MFKCDNKNGSCQIYKKCRQLWTRTTGIRFFAPTAADWSAPMNSVARIQSWGMRGHAGKISPRVVYFRPDCDKHPPHFNIGHVFLCLTFNPAGALGFFGKPASVSKHKSLVLLGATEPIPIANYHMWWSLLSANYLHGSIMHMAFDVVALWRPGRWWSRNSGPTGCFQSISLAVGGETV